MPKQTQDPKPKPAPKSELILEVALEAQYFRNPGLGLPFVLIPNHPTDKTPVPLLENFDFKCWLTWRCYKKHGFIATSALINSTIRYLTGLAMYDETIPVWDNETKQITSPAPTVTTSQPPTGLPKPVIAPPFRPSVAPAPTTPPPTTAMAAIISSSRL